MKTLPVPIAEKYFKPENLFIALQRVIRHKNPLIKDRHGIERFGATRWRNDQQRMNNRMADLSIALMEGTYAPARPYKFYEPKKNFAQRAKTCLRVEDAIVYQALTNKFAEAAYPLLTQYRDIVLGSILNEDVRLGDRLRSKGEKFTYFFFEHYLENWKKFSQQINQAVDDFVAGKRPRYRFAITSDLTAFFDTIPHARLLEQLGQKAGAEPEILEFLSSCLNSWSGTRDGQTPGMGIPQGPDASAFMANLFLHDLDELILNRFSDGKGWKYFRYMDDIRVFIPVSRKIKSSDDAKMLLIRSMDRLLRSRGLFLNASKTKVIDIQEEGASRAKILVGKLGPSLTGAAEDPGPDPEQEEEDLLSWEEAKANLDQALEIGFTSFLVDYNEEEESKEDRERRLRRSLNIYVRAEGKKPKAKYKKLIHQLASHYEYFANGGQYLAHLSKFKLGKGDLAKLFQLEKKYYFYESIRYAIYRCIGESNLELSEETQEKYLDQATEEPDLLARFGMLEMLAHQAPPGSESLQKIMEVIEEQEDDYFRDSLRYMVQRVHDPPKPPKGVLLKMEIDLEDTYF